MTQQEMEADLKKYKESKEQLMANLNALAGIVQYLEQKLTEAQHGAAAASQEIKDLIEQNP